MAITTDDIAQHTPSFQRVFSRLTPAEFAIWMNANGATVSVDDLKYADKAEGALTEWEFDRGNGTISGGVYFAAGMDSKRAVTWYNAAKSAFELEPTTFVNLVTGNDSARGIELIRNSSTVDLTLQPTIRAFTWDSNRINTLYPNSTHPDRIIKSLSVFRWINPAPGKATVAEAPYNSQWGFGQGQENGTAATVGNRLATFAAGKRFVLLRQPQAASDDVVGMCYRHRAGRVEGVGGSFYGTNVVYDEGYNDKYRLGMSLQNWLAEMTSPSGPWLTFLEALYAQQTALRTAGTLGPTENLVDGFLFDFEHRMSVLALQTGFTPVSNHTIESVNASTDVVTITNHPFVDGDIVRCTTTQGGLTATRPFFVHKTGANTFTLHTDLSDALGAGGNKFDIIDTTPNGKVLQRCADSIEKCMADASWPFVRDTVLKGHWNDAAILAGLGTANFASKWNPVSNHNALLMQSLLDEYYFGCLAQVMSLGYNYWPNAIITDWDMTSSATGTHGWIQPGSVAPLGVGPTTNHNGDTLYGEINAGRWNPTEFAMEGGTLTANYNTLNDTQKKTQCRQRLLQSLEKIYAVRSATTKPFHPWLGFTGSSGNGIYDFYSTGWEELVLLSALASDWPVGFYNSGVTVLADNTSFLECLAEVESVVHYKMGVVEPHPLIPALTQGYGYVRRWCGNRWVWRFFVDPEVGVGESIPDGNGVLSVKNANGVVLASIPDALVLNVTSKSSLGIWLEEYPTVSSIPTPAVGGSSLLRSNRKRTRLRHGRVRAFNRTDPAPAPPPTHVFDSQFTETFGNVDMLGSSPQTRNCVPGPGAITYTFSTTGRFNIGTTNAGKLTYAGNGGANTCKFSTTVTRAAGVYMTCKFRRTAGINHFGPGFWSNSDITTTGASDNAHIWYVNAGNFTARENNVPVTLEACAADTDYELGIVLRAAGAFYFIRGGGWGSTWQLAHIASLNTSATLHLGMNVTVNGQNGQLDDWRVPIATWLPTPSYDRTNPINDYTLSTLGLYDFIADFTVARTTGGVADNETALYFRATAGNAHVLYIFEDGSLKLSRFTNNTETQLITATSGTIPNSSTRVVRLAVYGTTMRLYTNNPTSAVWTQLDGSPPVSQTQNQTAPGMYFIRKTSEVLSVSSIKIWKRSWSDFPDV